MPETLGHGMPGTGDAADALRQFVRRAARMLGRIGFGVVVVTAVIIGLLATTFIGLLLGIAALFLSFSHGRRPATAAEGGAADDMTLDARPTASGWVIEPAGRTRR